jgi:hypothetical protein
MVRIAIGKDKVLEITKAYKTWALPIKIDTTVSNCFTITFLCWDVDFHWNEPNNRRKEW